MIDLSQFKVPDSSGRMSKESYVQKNYTNEYIYIIGYCKILNIDNIPFKEKVYLSINNLKSIPLCKNPSCKNVVKFRNSTLGYREYCSNKCISSDPNIKQIKENKSYEKFGTKTPAQSQIIKDKIINTNLEKYGGNSPMSSKEIQDKSKITLMDRYGVDNISKDPDSLNRRVESFKKNVDQYKASYKKTSEERYGESHPWKNNTIHNKSVESSREAKNITSVSLIKEKLLRYPTYKFVSVDDEVGINKRFKIVCPKGHEFIIHRSLVHDRWYRNSELCTECNPVNCGISGMEIIISNFIKDNFDGDVICNSRSIIPPHEIDIFIPTLKLGVEVNGLYWHSSPNKDMNYHLEKYNKSLDKGIKLITIWEDDWVSKNDICKSFILYKLNKVPNKIYARDCEVKEVSYSISEEFLQDNHFQGSIKSPVRIGLFFNNKLVSLMAFGNLRLAMSKKTNEEFYELTRFCNLNFYSVVGGASKLLNYFVKKYKPKKVETYSDNLISDGGLYEKLGFVYSHTSVPGYWYNVGGSRSHRYNWRKSKLVELGYDKTKTEEEIMNELGYHRIYNAGNKKWELIYN